MFTLRVPHTLSPSEMLDLAERAARVRELPGTTAALRADLDALMTHVGATLRRSSASVATDQEVAEQVEPEERAVSLVTVTPGEDGGFVATGPDGAVSQGATLPEALRNLAEVIDDGPVEVGDVLRRWSEVPPGALTRDGEGSLNHKRTDGSWCWWWLGANNNGRRGQIWPADDKDGLDAPWTVLALGVSDDVTGDEVARLVGDA